MCDLKAVRAILLAASLVLSGCGLDDDAKPKTPDTPQAAPLEAQTESLAGDQNPLINNQSADAGWAFYLAPASETRNPHSVLNRIRCALRDRMVSNPLKALGTSVMYGAILGLVAVGTQPDRDQISEERKKGSEYFEKLWNNQNAKKPQALGKRPENSFLPDNWFWASSYAMRRWMAHPLTAAGIAGACQAAITGFWGIPTGLLGARFAAAGAGTTAALMTMFTAAPFIRNKIHFDDFRYLQKYYRQNNYRPVSISQVSEALKKWNFAESAKYYAVTEIAPRTGLVALGAFAGTAIYLIVEAGSPYAKAPNFCPQDAPKAANAETTKDSE